MSDNKPSFPWKWIFVWCVLVIWGMYYYFTAPRTVIVEIWDCNKATNIAGHCSTRDDN